MIIRWMGHDGPSDPCGRENHGANGLLASVRKHKSASSDRRKGSRRALRKPDFLMSKSSRYLYNKSMPLFQASPESLMEEKR